MLHKKFYYKFNFWVMSLYLIRYLILFIFLFMLSACFSFKNQIKDEMVLIPEGIFTMGYNINNKNEWGDTDEEPVHKVFLKSYYMDRYEVSASQFSKFLNNHPDKAPFYFQTGLGVTIEKVDNLFSPKIGLKNYVANRISWYGADAYCKWISKRLPTEAEWEKASRGTDGRIFPWGNEFPTNERVTFRRKFNLLGFKALEQVDSMPGGQSPYGVHHMAGNAWEWVSDWYKDIYYEESPYNNPKGPESGITKVLRGGNWYYKAYYMRTTYRFNEKPDVFKNWQGFRCAKDLNS
ncbi:MAG: SUMF1/EgtB/PvdO family nonheme iron enzyme [Nitrospina sp.]|nr:SUMF1/EgtB/PvdO family nonheme iron enzyme [Nitrospina sp.]